MPRLQWLSVYPNSKVICINAAQQKRLGKLLALGVPLVVALPIAMADPEDVIQEVGKTAKAIDNARTAGLDLAFDAVTDRPKAKRKVSAYSRKYKAAFKKVSGRYRMKSGRWKKGGFKAAVKAAHKAVKK